MFRLIHIAILVILVVTLITQIICPMFGIFSDRFFWVFRKKEKEIDKTLAQINEIEVDKQLKEVVKLKDKKLKDLDEENQEEIKTQNTENTEEPKV